MICAHRHRSNLHYNRDRGTNSGRDIREGYVAGRIVICGRLSSFERRFHRRCRRREAIGWSGIFDKPYGGYLKFTHIEKVRDSRDTLMGSEVLLLHNENDGKEKGECMRRRGESILIDARPIRRCICESTNVECMSSPKEGRMHMIPMTVTSSNLCLLRVHD
jgi:hypothetical protein